ncbi:MAG: GNAT family N-acetyltransferase [Paracoccaceae bacterium]
MNILSQPMRVEVMTDPAALIAVAPAWRALHRAAGGGPFSTIAWIAATTGTFGTTGVQPCLAVVWQADRLVAGALLALGRGRLSRRGPRVMRLQMLCQERVGFHEVLALPGLESPAMDALAGVLMADKRWALLDLTPMLASSALEALRDGFRRKGMIEWVRPEIHHTICDLTGGYEAYLGRHNRTFRKAVRQTATRVAAAGGQVLQARGDDPGDDTILERALAVSARCWKARAGTDLGTLPMDRTFTSSLWSGLSARKAMRILLLTINGRDAASVFMLREGAVEYGWVCDFDEAFAELSPGRFMLCQALETAAADHIETVDFMRSTPFTERFADRIETYDRIRLCRPGNPARLWIALQERMRPLGSDLRRWYRQRTRKRIAFKAAASEGIERDSHDESG